MSQRRDSDRPVDVAQRPASGQPAGLWVDGEPPPLLGADVVGGLGRCVAELRAEMDGHVRAVLPVLVEMARLPVDPELRDANGLGWTPPGITDERVWRAALYGHDCSGVVWATPPEARELLAGVDPGELDRLGGYLHHSGLGTWAWCQIAGRWRLSGVRSHRLVDGRFLHGHVDALGQATLAIDRHEPRLWHSNGVCLDDLAPYVMALLDHRCRSYRHDHDGIAALPDELAALVTDHPKRTFWAPVYHHAMLLVIVEPLVEAAIDDSGGLDPGTGGAPMIGELVARLADDVAGFLAGERGLPCSEIPLSDEVTVHEPVRVADLAVLAQHLAYEHPASEIEAHLYTRVARDGGVTWPDVGSESVDTAVRLAAIALLHEPSWPQTRRVLTHRVLRETYRQVTHRLLDTNLTTSEQQLAHATLRHLDHLNRSGAGHRNLYAHAGAVHVETARDGQGGSPQGTWPRRSRQGGER